MSLASQLECYYRSFSYQVEFCEIVIEMTTKAIKMDDKLSLRLRLSPEHVSKVRLNVAEGCVASQL